MEGENDREKEKIGDTVMFVLCSFLAELRGKETLRLVWGESREFFEGRKTYGKYKHVVLPLRDKFKWKNGKGFHLVVVTARTNSGLQIRLWLRRLLDRKGRRVIIQGLLFVDDKGSKASFKDFEGEISGRITRAQSSCPQLIMSSIDVQEEYGLLRSFCRGSNSEALNRVVSEATIDRNNRWIKVDRAGSRKAKLQIRDHYTEVLVSLKRYLENSQAL